MPATDNTPTFLATPQGPFTHAATVSPNDSTDLSNVASAIYCGATGAIALVTTGGETVTFLAVPAGTVLRIRTTRVMSANTTSTSIVALW